MKGAATLEVDLALVRLKRWLVEHAGAEAGREIRTTVQHHPTGPSVQPGCRVCAVHFAVIALENPTPSEELDAAASAAAQLLELRDAVRVYREGGWSFALRATLPPLLGTEATDAFMKNMAVIEANTRALDEAMQNLDQELRAWLEAWFPNLAFPGEKPKHVMLTHLTLSLANAGFAHADIARLLPDRAEGDLHDTEVLRDQRVADRLARARKGVRRAPP